MRGAQQQFIKKIHLQSACGASNTKKKTTLWFRLMLSLSHTHSNAQFYLQLPKLCTAAATDKKE